MNFSSPGTNLPVTINVSAALSLAQRAHDTSLASSGADVFSQLKLDRASIAAELPSLACAPIPPPGYTSAPAWKPWQDFCR
jgi:hypothetical protein